MSSGAGGSVETGWGTPPPGVETLSDQEIAARLSADGPNLVAPEPARARWKRWLGPLADPMVALLLIAAPTYLLIGETVDAIVATIALVPVAGVGWLLEGRAERTLQRLRELTSPEAVVWRGGAHIRVRAEDVVVGDLCWVREGDVIPADSVVIEASEVMVDEAALTGESLPVSKADLDGDRSVWAGTTVLSGRAVAQVVATGSRTRYGEIGALLGDARRAPTPLQRALTRLVRVLAVVAAVFCVAVVGAELANGSGWGNAVIAGVSLAIAAIPEEFSIVYTLYLALGAWQLARTNALVRTLPGVETLGSTTVICTDKTGTLTEGRLAVATLVPSVGDETAVLEAAVLASEPDPFDPLDRAIVDTARLAGIDVDALHRGELCADWPFDPADKYVTHVWHLGDGTYRVAAKGSLEGIVTHSHAASDVHERIQAEHERLAERGLRVIAVAAGTAGQARGDRGSDESGLQLVGLVAFEDPLREGIAGALAECRTAGIRVIMITGDHPATAHAIAEGLALPHTHDGVDRISTGADLDAATPEELDQLVATTNVFARTRPEQKYRLVEALRRRGEVVAMTGDGINDAPALRVADIGIAMGRRGTPVAREAATMVLLDDNFATIVTATRNGRRIYDNLVNAFAYLIAFHPPLLFAATLIPLLDRPLLLLPFHLVVLEILLHPIVSLVFQAEPAASDVMHRPPRSAASALRARSMWRPYAVGCALAGGVISTYLVALDRGWPVAQARGVGLAVLLTAQPFLLLTTRRPDTELWGQPLRPTRELVGAVTALVAVIAALIYVPALARLARIEAFPAEAWLAVISVAALTTLWTEPTKGRRRAG